MNSGRQFFDPAGNHAERLAGGLAIGAPGLSQVGPATAATPAQRFGTQLNEIDRADPVRQVIGDADDKSGLAVTDPDNCNNPRPDPLLLSVSQGRQTLVARAERATRSPSIARHYAGGTCRHKDAARFPGLPLVREDAVSRIHNIPRMARDLQSIFIYFPYIAILWFMEVSRSLFFPS